jgi:hypothetical protein
MGIPEKFLAVLQALLAGVEDLRLRRLLLLAATGESGPYAFSLIRDFKDLGVLHLLVLSGSQAGALRQAFQSLIVIPSRFFPFSQLLQQGGVLAALFLYGLATGWPPPLTRALFFEALLICVPRLEWKRLLGLALLLQCLFFTSHLSSLGFYLSWFSSLALRFSREGQLPAWQRNAILSCACQCLVCLLKEGAFPGYRSWIVLLLANAVIGALFDRILSPILGFGLALAILLTLIPQAGALELAQIAGNLAAPILSGAGSLILVAVRGLMYTF